MKSLVSLTPICSILLQLAVSIGFQLAAFFYVKSKVIYLLQKAFLTTACLDCNTNLFNLLVG